MKKLFITFSLFLLSSMAFGQLNENFTNGIPTNWATFNTGTNPSTVKWSTTTSSSFACNGRTALMNANQNIGLGKTTENWMVTNLVSVPADGELRLFTKADIYNPNEITLQVRISTTSQTNPASFTTIKTWSSGWINISVDPCKEEFVDLSAYAGRQVYIAFVGVIRQTTSATERAEWAIDNVRVSKRCPIPTLRNFLPGGVGLNEVTLTWDDPYSSAWEIEVRKSSQIFTGSGVVVTTNPYRFANLTPNVEYYYRIRSICDDSNTSPWTNPVYFNTECPIVRGISFRFVGNDAIVSWDSSVPANWETKWEVEFIEVGQAFTGVGVITNSNSHIFRNLDRNRTYQAKVRSICTMNGVTYPRDWIEYWPTRCLASLFSVDQEITSLTSKDKCINKLTTFNVTQDSRFNYVWRIYNSNDILVTTLNGPQPTYSFSDPGNYYCILEATSNDCKEYIKEDFEIKPCIQCEVNGEILNISNLCIGENNYFWYTPNPNTPINFSDPNLSFYWSVIDTATGAPLQFEPVYLFGSLPYFINVPFNVGGNFDVILEISGKDCKSLFKKNVKVEKCSCAIKGEIGIKSDKKICAGTKMDLYFSEDQPGFVYNWNILNSNYQSVYSSSEGYLISPTISTTGEYVALLNVKDKNGCENVFIYHFKVENCGDKCFLGDINSSAGLCEGGNNFFWFVPDVSTPIDFTDPNLVLEWSVTDPNGNPVSFEPVNLFGTNLAYYIQVPFSMEGDYVIDLLVGNSKCEEKFKKIVSVAKECKCHTKGKIELLGDKICAGEEITLSFSEPQSGYQYSWNILNSSYQSIYALSGASSGITTVINQEGTYAALLTIIDAKGCQMMQMINFKVDKCGVSGGDCYSHLAFSFATPNSRINYGLVINDNTRQAIAKGVVDFVNQNTNGKLFITTVDDHISGSTFAAKQQNILAPLNQPTITSSKVFAYSSVGNDLMLRIQNMDYDNTISKNFNLISNSSDINLPIDINFVIVSKENTTSDIITSYNNLMNSGKVKRIFFVIHEGADFVLNGENLHLYYFLNQITNTAPVSYTQTNSVLNSNYVIIPSTVNQQPTNVSNFLKTFFQNAYNEIKKTTICDENCLKGEIKNQDSLCAGADNTFWFNPTDSIDYTDPQLNFSWLVKQNGNLIPYEIVNGNNSAINLPNALAGNYTITLVVSNSHCTKTYVKNVTVRSCTVPSCGDSTNQFQVIKLFKDLLEHLKNQPSGTITNGYVCAELMSLMPYINPSITNPAIYNFSKSNNTLSFSFSSNASAPHVVFKLPSNPNSVTWLTLNNYANMNNQTSFSSLFLTFDPFWPSSQIVSGSTVSQVNFCPSELNCVNHIAIVLDESTSITSVDAGRIRGQLKKFVEQQVTFSQTHGSQLRLTLIGLSDQDNDVRTDQITNMLVNATNKQTLINWINKYKTRYSQNLSGINSNSDYWNSGLYKAAQTNASLVILITDGAQTENLNTLKTTIGLFNNSGNATLPRHLHVIGLSEGYYVNGAAGASRYSNSFNPNLAADILDEDGEVELTSISDSSISSRLTNNLRISLRYLIYGNLQFPEEATLENPFSKDYSAHTNFKFLYDDPYYLSNGIYYFFGRTCGESQYLDKCDECDGVQLDKEKSYIVSGWVHVDQKLQVPSFRDVDSPSIEIVFLNEAGIALNDYHNNETGITYKAKYEFFPQGNIIDGWQRIFGVFDVHTHTVYMEILLNNASEKNAVHFDDIRIHPRSGSMKSFIYDDQNYKLMSELDENNYSTYYEYDAEGGLVRIKKETERGIKTIQETRSGSVVKPE